MTHDPGPGHADGAAADLQRLEGEGRAPRCVPSSSATMASRSASVSCTLRSASSLNRVKAALRASPVMVMPILARVSAKAWRPECLPSTIWLPDLADGGGVDDLVGRALGQHAVLVDAGLVGEGVAAHDGLVVLHRVAGEAADQPAGAGQLLGAHAGLDARELVGPDLDGHDHLLQGGVAGPLAQAVHAHLDLAGAGLHAGQRVGRGQAQVVVAVDRRDVVALDLPADVLDQGAEVPRDAVADGVGDVQGGGARRRPPPAAPRA